MNGKPIRILIGDDHHHARQAMRLILAQDDTFEVVGEAKDGQEVLDLMTTLLPDIVLMDINMPKINGLEATKILKDQYPQLKIVMVTVSDDVSDLFEAIKRGAQGYLIKNLDPSIWLEYLHSIALDESPMPTSVAHQILKEFSSPTKGESPNLTPREIEILKGVASGLSNKELSLEFHISEHTVKNHLKNIMKKLHLHNRVQLTKYAFEHHLV